jgi:hypothetical protein
MFHIGRELRFASVQVRDPARLMTLEGVMEGRCFKLM